MITSIVAVYDGIIECYRSNRSSCFNSSQTLVRIPITIRTLEPLERLERRRREPQRRVARCYADRATAIPSQTSIRVAKSFERSRARSMT